MVELKSSNIFIGMITFLIYKNFYNCDLIHRLSRFCEVDVRITGGHGGGGREEK